MKVNRDIPVYFEKVNQLDDRFVQVKIWLMHLGENYNGSIFSKESVINAMHTLKNTPILGYIEESRFGNKDFRGHESELIVENGDYKFRYIGRAFGVIPENCNPRFETKKGDLGQELEYLVVDGLMWTKFDEAVDILENYGEVGQSMELHDDYDGFFDENGVFNFSRFAFYGACLLGQDVSPAMQKASVEKMFSSNVNVFQEEITKKLEEFNLAFSKNEFNKEVEQGMTLEELLAKYEFTVESLADKGVDVSEFSVEELEEKLKEFSSDEKEEKEDEKEEFEDEKGNEENEDKKEDEDKEFEDKEEENPEENFESLQSKITEYEKTIADLKAEVSRLNNEVDVLSSEKETLENFKKEADKAKHESEVEALFAKFDKLTNEDLAELKANIHDFSISEIESKLFEMIGRKMAFSSNKKKEAPIEIKFSQKLDENTSSYSHILAKHGLK